MKILNKLTIKHLLLNKKRTIVTIIGVLLSTALMVGIGLLLSTVQDNALRTAIAYSGDYHVQISDLEVKKLSILDHNKDVKDYFYEELLGFSLLEEPYNKHLPYVSIHGVSSRYFDNLTLVSGRFPVSAKEIVIDRSILADYGSIYEIGDMITLPVGDRIVDGEVYPYDDFYIEGETLSVREEQTYKIVGIVSSPCFSHSIVSYQFYTRYDSSIMNGPVTVFARFEQPKKAFEATSVLAKNLGLSGTDEESLIDYNYSVLSMYGVSKYDNIEDALSSILCIVLTLISIGCTIVIYNSFAISVMERKKQFGLFSSIGATKKQLRHTVFFEAMIIGLIGIPLGILSSFLGIGIVISIINQLLPGAFTVDLVLTANTELLLIPILFMVVVVFASAYIPAFRASRITPIEAIRQNDDIKIKGKLKGNRLVSKMFGIEGDIAFKNIKRNKKKYRITIISLVVSIVLFVSFSTFVEYGLDVSNEFLDLPDYDIQLQMDHPSTNDYTTLIDSLKAYEGVEDYTLVKFGELYSTSYTEDIYHTTILDTFYRELEKNHFVTLGIVALEDSVYQDYLHKLGLQGEKTILLNRVSYVNYDGNSRKVYTTELLQDDTKDYTFALCQMIEEEETAEPFTCIDQLEDIYITDQIPFALEQYTSPSRITLMVPMQKFEQLFHDGDDRYFDEITMYLKIHKYEAIDQFIETQLEDMSNSTNIHYDNVQKALKMQQNFMLVTAILLYGFITLVTLIGVTSVFNTIHTSMALRRKEFAMLRSMGLTPKGFLKILQFESIFFGIKSLLYGLPLSFLVIFWIHSSMLGIHDVQDIMIPWKSVLIAVIAVFVIVYITMVYATSKIKKENILDAIREENI